MNGDRPEGADIGQATGDEINRTVGGHDSGSQAGRSPVRRGVLERRLRAARWRVAAALGHRTRQPRSAAATPEHRVLCRDWFERSVRRLRSQTARPPMAIQPAPHCVREHCPSTPRPAVTTQPRAPDPPAQGAKVPSGGLASPKVAAARPMPQPCHSAVHVSWPSGAGRHADLYVIPLTQALLPVEGGACLRSPRASSCRSAARAGEVRTAGGMEVLSARAARREPGQARSAPALGRGERLGRGDALALPHHRTQQRLLPAGGGSSRSPKTSPAGPR